MSTQVRPYGAWPSPVSAEMVASKSVSMSNVLLTEDNRLYWVESRPEEGGRHVVMRLGPSETEPRELTPAPYNVRTRVHEYGGMPYTVDGEVLYFSHYADHRLYRQVPGGSPEPVTPEAPMRYADPVWDGTRSRIVAVREDHTMSDIAAINTIVAVDPAQGTVGTVLAEGWDFYMYPRISPNGRQMAWICWNHPNMPWDGTELWIANIGDDGKLSGHQRVAGGPNESIFEPSWSPDGVLYFVSDRTGWWNIYRFHNGSTEAVTEMTVEFGQPNWGFGMSTYGFAGDDIVATYSNDGYGHLVRIDPATLAVNEISCPYSAFSEVRANNERAVFLAGSPEEPQALVSLDAGRDSLSVVQAEGVRAIDAVDTSIPQAIAFETTRGQTAHMWFYPPKNHAYTGPAGEKPPLIVFNHGGPTSHSAATLKLTIQYFTTRGFAVADVNYRGSTGYGRAYRRLLNESWGIVDVEDCCNAAQYLAREGLVDGQRMAIRGGSAGGYTTLACLTFRDVFAAGASYYGVSDLGALARETHKFESRYMDKMVGPWPDAKDVYEARSPIAHMDQARSPIIFFQGLDDKIVLPNQAEMMVDELRRRGVPVAYLAFEGEGHGFRRADTIIRTLEAELYFYAEIMAIPLAEPVTPVPIANWVGDDS